MLIVLSGPSGVGKSLTLRYLVSSHAWKTVIPFTTRQKRPLETEGLDYYFRSEAILRNLFNNFKIGYWDQPVDTNWYGYSAEVNEVATEAQGVVIQASSRIALTLKKKYPQTQLIFCDFATDMIMYNRIRLRCEPGAGGLASRLRHAQLERSRKSEFDSVVTCDDPLELRNIILRKLERVASHINTPTYKR